MGVLQQGNRSDADTKTAIVAFLTAAATEGGTEAIAAVGKVQGPQSLSAIRSCCGGGTRLITRLVAELVDAGTIVRNKNNSEAEYAWTYSPA